MCLLYLLNQKGLWKCHKIEFNKTWITHKTYVQFIMSMNTWTSDFQYREYCVLHIISHFGLLCQLTDAPYQRRQFISCDYSMNSFTFLIWSWINVNGSRTLILLTETLFLQFVFLNRQSIHKWKHCCCPKVIHQMWTKNWTEHTVTDICWFVCVWD